MRKMEIKECTRDNFCFECDNKNCVFCGDIGAECPKYKCDMPEPMRYECEKCPWIRNYINKLKEGNT